VTQPCFSAEQGYCASVSYRTLEVEIDHGRVSPKGAEALPVKGSGLLTILNPDDFNASLPARSELARQLMGAGRHLLHPGTDPIGDLVRERERDDLLDQADECP
jgi:hypothetical protein